VSERAPKNLAASIRQKLSDLARARKVDFGLILVKYGLERILYRLTRSAHHDAFVLKGALRFASSANLRAVLKSPKFRKISSKLAAQLESRDWLFCRALSTPI
jgi:hypothetical protein